MKYLLLVLTLVTLIGSPSDGLTRMKHLSPGSAIKLSSIALSPTSVVGGSSSQGTVTLTKRAPSGGVVVILSSNQPSVASVPASVTVASGQTIGTFTVTTSTVSVTTVASVSASYGGVTKTANLTVTAADTTAPIISVVAASNITTSEATITWTTNEASDTQVDYGTTTAYGSSSTLVSTLVTSHSATLSGLSASTLYHYRVKSRDAVGNLATSGDFTFDTSATGVDYYVATDGNDSYSCAQAQNISTPKATLRAACDCLSSGDRLLVRAGTYAAGIFNAGDIPNGGSFATATKIQRYQNETVIFKGIDTDPAFTLSGQLSYIILDGIIFDAAPTNSYNAVKLTSAEFGLEPPNHIRFTNCEMKNAQYSGILISDRGTVNQGFHEFINVRVNNNGTRSNLDHGIYVEAQSCLIEYSEFYNNAAYGVQFDNGPTQNSIVRFCRIHDNSSIGNGGGIYLNAAGNPGNHRIYNNLIYNNASYGIQLRGKNTILYNNTFYANTGIGLYVLDEDGGFIRNNISYGTVGSPLVDMRLETSLNCTVQNNLVGLAIQRILDTGTLLTNNVVGNPMVVNASTRDFHLQSNSAAKDTGQDLSTVLTNDFDGHSRPQGAGYDIGAYEFTP